MKEVLKNCYDNGGNPSVLMAGSFNKQTISSFSGIAANRFQVKAAEPGTIIGAADIYVSDFGELSVVPNRFQPTRNVFALDTEYWAMATLRPMSVKELAKTGDAEKRLAIVEFSLMSKNEQASGAVYDCTTA